MKIRRVVPNNRKKAFEVSVGRRVYVFPYAVLDLQPTSTDRIARVYVDKELGNEGFTFLLESGREDSVHIDDVLFYNRDPSYMRDLLLYKLSVEAQKRVSASPLAKREIIRRLGTSATQFYRLLDPTNCRKSIGQMVSLLFVLDCEVRLEVRKRRRRSA